MPVEQLSFDMSAAPIYRWENYYVSPANEEAVNYIRQWPMWNNRTAVIVGPAFGGKSHLAHLWQQESRAEFLDLKTLSQEEITKKIMAHPFCIVENLRDEDLTEKLLVLYNLIQENQGYLLLSATQAPSDMHTKIPDLASRLNAVPVLRIKAPEDDLLKALLVKRFADQQLAVPTPVIEYILKHMERSYQAVQTISQHMDQLSLQHKRNLTVPFVKEILFK